MELLTHYNGAVFFIDLLGMGALTQGLIPLEAEDYTPWLEHHEYEHNNQFLAAAVVAEFRKLLAEYAQLHTDVTVTQLSDGAFIWSRQPSAVVTAAGTLMSEAIKNGVLCRGGMAYGQIIETNQAHALGRFIVGQAVTDAVKLEGLAKGARVLVNSDFPHSLWERDKAFAERMQPLFEPFTNPLDFSVYDEFKWYLVPKEAYQSQDLRLLSKEDRIKFTKIRLKLANVVRCAPRLSWNSRTGAGRVQVTASISILAQNHALGVSHNFEWNDSVEKRSQSIVNSINQTLEADTDYVYRH
ncbi:hypothetical protein EAH73_15820 [Hymenobacter nivis]|uniref:Guanylate cyclase domain-containing protein n=1 Tax=Hymenobacter nivis TaxID=1850093 RepID=A0A502GTP7_9BACT|nr:hypothetical protein EAH73_15820 [Hymenobacter nivis]